MTDKRRFSVNCAAAIVVLVMGFEVVCGLARAADLPPAKPLVVPVLRYEKYTLPNGLEVILYENHKLPLVALDLWYHVGPVDEKAGRTGFAHLFEHMMFEGSEHVGEKAQLNTSRAPALRTSTELRTTTGPTISRRCQATSWSWGCGWRATGWGSCWRHWTVQN